MITIPTLVTLAVAALLQTVTPPSAQMASTELRELVGMRGSSGEAELIARGYVDVRGEVAEGEVRTWWLNASRGRCVAIVTRDGRYASVLPTPLSACLMAATPAASQAPEGRTETLRFARGASGARKAGVLMPPGRIIYLLSIRAGQRLEVRLDCSTPTCAFDLSAPRSSDVMHNGVLQGRSYVGSAPLSGVYRIEIFDSGRPEFGEATRFDLEVRVTG